APLPSGIERPSTPRTEPNVPTAAGAPSAPAGSPVRPSAPAAAPPATTGRDDAPRTVDPPRGIVLEPPSRPVTPDRSRSSRAQRVRRCGGSRRTEDAVESGLQWRAAHQNPDGTWSRARFPLLCPAGERGPGVATVRTKISLEPGLTGLCLL